MTNPLTELELAACKHTQYEFESHDDWQFADREARDRYFFAAALDYLRAELAKEEPVGHFQYVDDPLGKRIERVSIDFKDEPDIFPLYLRPSEPTPCPFIETSKGGTSYCRLAAGQSKEPSHRNLAMRLAGFIFGMIGVCPECGNSGRHNHLASCPQTYEREFKGPQDCERVFALAFESTSKEKDHG